MDESDPSELWDRWKTAKAADPWLTPEAFARDLGPDGPGVLAVLLTLIEVERTSEPSALVDALLAPEGMIFAGYRIVRSLGQGSAGVVFLAVDEKDPTGDSIALKVLNPLLAASPERRETILHEARIAARLKHPGIVRVKASGIERGYAWIATEWVEGSALGTQTISEADRARVALDVGLQMARALQHTHELGVIHRDLKPANVIRSSSGAIKILDFGLARAEGTTFAVSRTGEAVGTPLYMAPEQWRGDSEVGPWTDVFAIGLLMWEIATGRKLSADGDMADTLRRIASNARRLSRRDLAALPPDLRAIVSRCTESDARDRYRDCTSLLMDLEAMRDGRRLEIGALSTRERWKRRMARHPVRATALSFAVVAILLAAWFTWSTWPVLVTFREERGGKTIFFDGREIGTSPVSLYLRPGRHAWEAKSESPSALYTGELNLRRGEPSSSFLMLDPPYGHEEMTELSSGGAQERRAWVVVDTTVEAMKLVIDGHVHEVANGLATFRLPLGPHTIDVISPGKRTIHRDFELADQSLCAFAFEPDDETSPWTTTVLYSPLDRGVQDAVFRFEGLRLFFERSSRSISDPTFVSRAYFGPKHSREAGLMCLDVDLGVEVHDLEIRVCTTMLVSVAGGFSRIEMGAREEDLVPVADFDVHHARLNDAIPADPLTHALLEPLPKDVIAAVLERVRGTRHLIVRWSAGGVPAGGDDSVRAQVLRAHVLPMRDTRDGSLMWAPALRIRAR